MSRCEVGVQGDRAPGVRQGLGQVAGEFPRTAGQQVRARVLGLVFDRGLRDARGLGVLAALRQAFEQGRDQAQVSGALSQERADRGQALHQAAGQGRPLRR